MTPTKDQQAQEYAEKILNENSAFELDYFGLPQAWLDGHTACEQSMWRSVEEELPEDMVNVLVHCSDADPELSDCIAYIKNMVWYFLDDFYIGCTVSHWMPIPPIPDTNTDKI